MSTGAKVAAGAGGLILAWILLPFWLFVLVFVGVPVGFYLMLDESQRRKLRGRIGRKELGS